MLDAQFSSVLCQVLQVPVKFLSSGSLPRALAQFLARLCSYTPPKSSPAAPAFRRAGPKACQLSSFSLLIVHSISGSVFYRLLADFGAPKAPQNGTKTSLFPPFFLSLFWLLFLTPNCTKKCHSGGARTMNPCGLASVCSMFGLLDQRPQFTEKRHILGAKMRPKRSRGPQKRGPKT